MKNKGLSLQVKELATQLSLAGTMPHILAVEDYLFEKAGDNPIELPVNHHHLDGVYIRELFMPAGTLLTGKIHHKEHISILAQGEIRLSNGKEFMQIKAPHIMKDPPGTKRLIYALRDSTFINVIPTDKETLEDIEEEVVSDTFEQFAMKTLVRLGV